MAFNLIIDVYRSSNPELYNTIRIRGYKTKKQALTIGKMTAKNEVLTQERLRGVKCSSRIVITEDNTTAYR